MAAKRKKAAVPAPKEILAGSGSGQGLQVRDVQALLSLLEGTDVTELDVTVSGIRVVLRRSAGPPAAPTYLAYPTAPMVVAGPALPSAEIAPSPGAERTGGGEDTQGKVTIDAPMVGTFYRAPSPNASVFVEEGHTIGEGQTICIIEAMKLMNEIKSEIAGKVVRVLVENGQPVEYGQPLFLVEPASA